MSRDHLQLQTPLPFASLVRNLGQRVPCRPYGRLDAKDLFEALDGVVEVLRHVGEVGFPDEVGDFLRKLGVPSRGSALKSRALGQPRAITAGT